MRNITVLILLLGMLCLMGCNSHVLTTDPDTGEQNRMDTTEDSGTAENVIDLEDTTDLEDTSTDRDVTQDTTLLEETEPETTESGRSDWLPTEPEPTESETTDPKPTDPDPTDTDSSVDDSSSEEQESSAETDLEYTEPNTTPMDDPEANTESGWGPIV